MRRDAVGAEEVYGVRFLRRWLSSAHPPPWGGSGHGRMAARWRVVGDPRRVDRQIGLISSM